MSNLRGFLVDEVVAAVLEFAAAVDTAEVVDIVDFLVRFEVKTDEVWLAVVTSSWPLLDDAPALEKLVGRDISSDCALLFRSMIVFGVDFTRFGTGSSRTFSSGFICNTGSIPNCKMLLAR